jgi:bifunctional non-homologous end joining protein LigD
VPAARTEPSVAGIRVSHPDRVVFPAARATKLDLARYYDTIGVWMLPHLVDRPLTLLLCPNGIPRTGATKGADCLYMKHAKAWGPSALRRVRIREKTKVGEYLIADDLPALVGLAQMNAIEIHTWNATHARIERPDRIVIDLDPGERVGWPAVVAAARLVRRMLSALDLESFVKTTGGRGLHVVVPIVPQADWSECLEFARAIALTLVRERPAVFTEQFAKTGRAGKILVDYLRNNRTNTSVAAFSTRARPDGTVSVPLAWTELSAARPPSRWTIATVPQRLQRMRGDPWQDYWTVKQRLPRAAVRAVERM